MKCFKKVAALLFCVALALSVMAVSAMADDEAELLAGVGKQGNPEFEVTLVPNATANTSTYDRDANGKSTTAAYEINVNDSVTFDIMLSYAHDDSTPYPAFNENSKIHGFEFDYDTNAGSGSNPNTAPNYGAAITSVTMKDITVAPSSTYGTDTTTSRYAYSSAIGSAYQMSTDGYDAGKMGVKIGTITVTFGDSVTQNVDIYPTIENIMIYVEGEQYIQIPVKVSEGTVAGYIAGDDGAPSSFKTYYGDGTEHGTMPSGVSAVTSATVAPDDPVIVNPLYVVTVKHFQPNADSGIAELKDTSNDTYAVYDFTSGNANASVKPVFTGTKPTKTTTGYGVTVLPNEEDISGYTFWGWIVTDNTENSTTWAKYAETGDNAWSTETSFPATTPRTIGEGSSAQDVIMAGVPTWATHDWSKSGGVKKDLPTTGTVLHNAAYNFIPKATSGNNAAIPGGLVGNITLTPVYTRNVYIATFSAGDDNTVTYNKGQGKATFDASFSDATGTSSAAASYTKNYTIEDLISGNAPYDFLALKDTNSTDASFNGPQGLTRKGFKWVGWLVSDDNDATYGVPTDDRSKAAVDGTSAVVGYTWDTNETTRVNKESVLIFDDTHATTHKHYGDVKFTATWELNIQFAKIEYAYAHGSDALILVGVPSDSDTQTNYENGYTYKCNNGTNVQNMFIIPDSAQRTGYVDAAVKATAPSDEEYTFLYSALNNGNDANQTPGTATYVLYAYIAPAGTKEGAITLDETITKDSEDNNKTIPGNDTIAYDGDIDDDEEVNVGDFGNVNTLLANGNATVLSSSVHSFVKARLQADADATDADVAETNANTRKFGSIKDVKTIYDFMGYNSMNKQQSGG